MPVGPIIKDTYSAGHGYPVRFRESTRGSAVGQLMAPAVLIEPGLQRTNIKFGNFVQSAHSINGADPSSTAHTTIWRLTQSPRQRDINYVERGLTRGLQQQISEGQSGQVPQPLDNWHSIADDKKF